MFDDGAKGFIVVYAVHLTITFGDKASFVLVDGASESVFDAVDPFALNDVATRGVERESRYCSPLTSRTLSPWLFSSRLLVATL